ncbi:unnamed protein product [Ceratitis capitata]|uniref:(Mediterranean fruit fly) hypothetical protein n=1 Tax=Ceratitis capitata TaxID=7213 RepID=A0A811U2R5_CERCA|nr:unnamed protein product [Ceratitis capitata]
MGDHRKSVHSANNHNSLTSASYNTLSTLQGSSPGQPVNAWPAALTQNIFANLAIQTSGVINVSNSPEVFIGCNDISVKGCHSRGEIDYLLPYNSLASFCGNKKTTRPEELSSADILERLVISYRYDGDITGDKFFAKGDSFSYHQQQKLSDVLVLSIEDL